MPEDIAPAVEAPIESTPEPTVESVLAPGEVETTESVETPVEETTETPVEGEQQTTEEVVDGRVIPEKFKETFKAHPELKSAYLENKALKKEFPNGLQEIRDVKGFIAEVGGVEKLESLYGDSQALENADEMFRTGNPEIVKTMATEFPDGFGKIMPDALGQWSQLDTPAYNKHMASVIKGTLDNYDFRFIIHDLAKENPQAAEKLANIYNEISGIATKDVPKKEAVQTNTLDVERTNLEKEKTEVFQRGVANEISGALNSKRDSMLNSYLKPYGQSMEALSKSDPEVLAEIGRIVDRELSAKLKADEGWSKQYTSILKSKEHSKAVQHAKARIEHLLPDAIKKSVGLFFRGTKKPSAQAAPVTSTIKDLPAGTKRLTSMPNPKDVDNDRTTARMKMDGKVYLKGKPDLYVWE